VVLPGYERIEKLAEGGMGVVYRAFDPLLKRHVALKMLRADLVLPDRLGRFRKEAEALGRLQHPHIVQVYGWQEQANQPVLVLEYIAGGSLEQRLKKDRLPVLEAVRLVAVLARAVQAAHQAEIVHRDLKPANVLMAPPVEGNSGTVAGGFPKVSDFGLAYLANSDALTFDTLAPAGSSDVLRDDTRVTVTGDVVGTPAYMAPEQAGGQVKQVGPPADVWALGVILYRCLSGRMPFPGGNVLETLDWVKTRPPEPLPSGAPWVPEFLSSLCFRCLDKSPTHRPSSGELAVELEQFETLLRAAKMGDLSTRPTEEPVGPILPDCQELSLQAEESVARPAEAAEDPGPGAMGVLSEGQDEEVPAPSREEPDTPVPGKDLEEWAATLLLTAPGSAGALRPQDTVVPRKKRKRREKRKSAGRGMLLAAAGVLIAMLVAGVLGGVLIVRMILGR
jgi:serine/threonine protein kinase